MIHQKIAEKVREIGLDEFIELHRPKGKECLTYKLHNRIPMNKHEYRKLKFEFLVFRMIETYATAPCEGVRTPEMVADNLAALLHKKPIIRKYLKI